MRERKAFDKARRRALARLRTRELICSGPRAGPATSFMSDRYFVDTNILMYAHDTAAGAKHERAKALVEELWQHRTGVVSTQVLQELSVNLRRKVGRPLDGKTTRDIVTDYLTWHVVVNNGESILEALNLEAQRRTPFRDALVLQAAHTSGAEVLYSEDLSDGQVYGSVRVVNPFSRTEAEEITERDFCHSRERAALAWVQPVTLVVANPVARPAARPLLAVDDDAARECRADRSRRPARGGPPPLSPRHYCRR